MANSQWGKNWYQSPTEITKHGITYYFLGNINNGCGTFTAGGVAALKATARQAGIKTKVTRRAANGYIGEIWATDKQLLTLVKAEEIPFPTEEEESLVWQPGKLQQSIVEGDGKTMAQVTMHKWDGQYCSCGADTYICQSCGRILCSAAFPAEWRPDITGNQSAGNVCPTCLNPANRLVLAFSGEWRSDRIPTDDIPGIKAMPLRSENPGKTVNNLVGLMEDTFGPIEG